MKAIMTTLVFVTLGVGLACDDAPSPEPPAPNLEEASGDLVTLLPERVLVAVELRDLDGRWDELRAVPPLARLQDRMLDEIGLDARDVPKIAGPFAVLALVPDEAWREIVPVAVLNPPSPASALARLGRTDALTAVQARGAVWIGPASHARLVERIAAGDGTSFRQAVDFAALAERLPEGGLARAALHPAALREYLRVRAQMARSSPVRALAALLRSDLEAIEIAGFRRDITGGEFVTDAWVGFDAGVLPEAVTRALATARGPAVLPSDLAADVLLASSFRTEPEAGLAWLRSIAARDPSGPLRNLDFWIEEFEARTGRSVETDIVGALGERGLTLVLEGADGRGLEIVAILDASDPERLEAALVDLRDWLGEEIWGRSLGLTIPKPRRTDAERGAVHGLDFWSPFGTFRGPVFQVADGRLIVATGRGGLARGVEFARTAQSWVTPAWALEDDGPADEIVYLRTRELARVLGEVFDDGSSLFGAILEFLYGTGEGRLRLRYEERGLRLSGVLQISANLRIEAHAPDRTQLPTAGAP
ncbi:MAG: hypothetical protein JSW65_01335, partial [Candidatus Bipolaricaulota bacterium]